LLSLCRRGRLLQGGGDEIDRFGDDRVEHRVGAGDVVGTADCAELKFIARERKGTGAITVAGVLGKLGKDGYAGFKKAACLVLLAPPFSI